MIRMLQLEVTGNCQLACTHCFARSGPDVPHGEMTLDDWTDVIDQAAQLGIPRVQFIGGEPTMRPGFPDLVNAAVVHGLQVEVYSNLVRVAPAVWDVLRTPGVTIATSWYTDDRDEHETITGRDTWRQTKANIEQSLAYGIPLRVGMVRLTPTQRVPEGKAVLHELGVEHVGIDDVRGLGRAAPDGVGDVSELCGNCGRTVAGILPDGQVVACPMSRFMPVGDVRVHGLAALLPRLDGLGIPQPIRACGPDNDGQCHPCEPSCNPGCDPSVTGDDALILIGGCKPSTPCNPDNDGEDCRPANTDYDGD